MDIPGVLRKLTRTGFTLTLELLGQDFILSNAQLKDFL